MAAAVNSTAQAPPIQRVPQAKKSHPLLWVAVVILTSIGTTTAVVAGIAHFAPRVFLPPAFKAATDYVGPVGRLSLLGNGCGLALLTALSAGYLSSQKRAQAPKWSRSQQTEDPPFIACVKKSSYKEIETGLEKAQNLNEVDHHGHTALWHAVQRGSSYVYLLLQKKGIDVDLGEPLQAAARLDDWVSYDLLKNQGADESKVNPELTRTWKALIEEEVSCWEAFESLLSKEKKSEAYSYRSLCAYIRYRSTPHDREPLVAWGGRTGFKYRALCYRRTDLKEVADALEECGAFADKRLFDKPGNRTDLFSVLARKSSEGLKKEQVLLEAAKNGYHRVVAKLINSQWIKGDVDEALEFAKEHGHYPIVQMIEKWKAMVG